MAEMLACLIVFLVILTLPFYHDAAPGTTARSVHQRQQVRNLLRRLNKPAVASIKSSDGDIVDCVHISKQPAFDHPSLKNHTIQMRPSYYPGGFYEDSNVASYPFTQTWHLNGKCPENTVPIRRTLEEDVLKANSVATYGKKRPRRIPNLISIHDPKESANGHQYGVAQTMGDNKYYGTKAAFNLWQPQIDRDNDFSLAQLWIVSGSYKNNNLNTIETGWQVFPNRYKGREPRVFIYWTRDGYNNTGCYNLKCPGFVQTNNKIAFGVTQLSPVSTYGGSQHDIDISVWKDPKGGNWWLQMGSDLLGYWPSSIFSNLADSASTVQWGGEVESSPDASQTSTQMGSGHFPEEGFGKASYIKNIQVVDSTNHLKMPSGVGLIAPQPGCYNVQNGTSSDMGTYIYYGGPGKNPMCP